MAAVFLTALTGCQSFSSVATLAHVRVIDLSPEALSVDVYQGSNAVAYNLSYGTVTSYVAMAPGSYTMTVDVAGTRQVLSSVKGTFSAGGQYTLLVNNAAANLQQVLLADQLPQATGPSIRLINQAPRMGAVDVYLVPAGQRLTSVTPVVTNLAPGASTGYLPAVAGTCTAVMVPAGTIPSASTVPAHSGTQINYENGSARSLILIDAQSSLGPALQVIATIDAEPRMD